ncbi:hypothetical protein K6V39_11445 [Streptococcus suis]|uniref:hypothetical protein n=1 Tax=Streptococcus suis TaxID=1307 RepID=UPI001C94E6AB|nr:hypothetical protein [Streptococcus suis]MBY4963173.1 hypothetical protein [Streptococcus suis]MBY4969493.1 hypothetical protein [Streptococcus suis]MBY4980583.1 hypothetical protein [Streptococcus suis]MBY4989167.1 hypothetical protein [Streptococcus suis]MBY4995748.1 hypothetical protein [Streptococcus suis]
MKKVLVDGVEREYIQSSIKKESWEKIIDLLIKEDVTYHLSGGLEVDVVSDSKGYPIRNSEGRYTLREVLDNKELLDLIAERRAIKDSVIETVLSERVWLIIRYIESYNNLEAFYQLFAEDRMDNHRLLKLLQESNEKYPWLNEQLAQNKFKTVVPTVFWKNIIKEYASDRNYVLYSYLVKELIDNEEYLENKILLGIFKYYVKNHNDVFEK